MNEKIWKNPWMIILLAPMVISAVESIAEMYISAKYNKREDEE